MFEFQTKIQISAKKDILLDRTFLNSTSSDEIDSSFNL